MNISRCLGATGIFIPIKEIHVFQQCNRFSARDVFNLALSNYKKMDKHKGDNKESQLPRHHKYRQKTGGKLPVPSHIELKVIGTGKSGTAHGLFVNMDYFKYLFNSGEGTQRICMEQKLKLSKLEKIFITRNSWTNIGGIMGMCLTLESNNVPFINMYGPPNSDVLVTMSRTFAQLHSIQVDFQDISKETIEDEAMEITMIPLRATLPAEEPESKKPRLTQTTKKDMAVAYICKPKERPRKIVIEKCVELGVPRDKTIQKLLIGETVVLAESGIKITPQDILSPKLPERYFIVLECPTLNHIESLITSKQLIKIESPIESRSSHGGDPNPELILDIVVHFTPKHVFGDHRYQQWLKSFPEDTKHLVLNEDGTDIVFQGLYRLQAMLNLINPTIFPLLPHQTQQIQVAPEPPKNVTFGETGMSFAVRSGVTNKQGQFNKENCIVLNNKEYIDDAFEQEDFKKELDELKSKLDQLTELDIHDNRQYPEIIFLGTGSSIPNKGRNVSSILVHLSPDVCMVLDTGEDTAGQLRRMYGDNIDSILTKLKAVYISHLHADHHMGMIGVLNLRKECLERLGQPYTPLLLIAPGNYRDWILDVDENVFPTSYLLRLIPVETLGIFDAKDTNVDVVKDELKIQNIETCRVIHRQHPHAVKLTLADGYKLVYSGDTTPCNMLIEMGKNCDLLIHEATMEDGLKHEAAKKRHSTTSQAINVGMQMNAGFILLTHFSQRYAKIPIFNEKFTEKVGIAFDNMRVRPCDLHLLPLFQPALKALFSEEVAEMEEKTKTRIAKKQKEKEYRLQKQKQEWLQGPESALLKGKDKKKENEQNISFKTEGTVTDKKQTESEFFRLDKTGNILQNNDLPESSTSSQKRESCEKT